MALPKEPRQKMINLMYLVLTALLALNVSNEILNAFKTIDNSLVNSNSLVKSSNSIISSSLAEQGKKPELAAKVAIWKPKADSAIALANTIAADIEGLKDSLKLEAGESNLGDSVNDFKEDDLEAATRLFDVRGNGPRLNAKLQKFLTDVQNIVPAEQRGRLPK